jgi:hypothetical protein
MSENGTSARRQTTIPHYQRFCSRRLSAKSPNVALRRGAGRFPLDALVTPIRPETAMPAIPWTFL